MPSTPLRIALVCTPRSGNNWLRLLVGAALEIPTLAVHETGERQLAELPPECILAIHARRDPDFVAMLDRHGFRVLTIARHPCDVLVSILQFAVHESESGRWLDYRGGDETGILGTTPRSRSFAEYACGERAKQLFGATADWWDYPGAVTVRYEELVENPIAELGRLVAEYRPGTTPNLGEIIDRYSMRERRLNTFHNQIWKGTPGHWRTFITADIAREIAAAHSDHFSKLGYACDPDPDLTDSQADRNWVEAVGPGLRAALNRSQTSHTLERLTLHSAIETARLENNALAATAGTLRAECDGHLASGELQRQENHALAATVETLRTELRSQTERAESQRLENHALAATIESVGKELEIQVALVESARVELESARIATRTAEREVAECRERLVPFDGLQRFSIRVARGIQSVRDRMPKWSGSKR